MANSIIWSVMDADGNNVNKSVLFGQGKVELNNKVFSVYAFDVDASNIDIEKTGNAIPVNSGKSSTFTNAKSWANSNKFGVNAGFFGLNYPHHLTSLHVNNGQLPFTTSNGGLHGCGSTDSGGQNPEYATMSFARNNLQINSRCGANGGNHSTHENTAAWPNTLCVPFPNSNLAMSELTWAIGGFDMMLSETFSKSSFESRMKSNYNNIPALTEMRPRTAICQKGYNKTRINLVTIFTENPTSKSSNGTEFSDSTGHGADVWDVHCILKNEFDSNLGFMIDGGGSTQMSYKTSQNGTACYVRAGARAVPTRIVIK